MPIPTRTVSTRQRPEAASNRQVSKAASSANVEIKSTGSEPTSHKAGNNMAVTSSVASARSQAQSTSRSTSATVTHEQAGPQKSEGISKAVPSSSRIAPPRTGPSSSSRAVGQNRQASITTSVKGNTTANHTKGFPTTSAVAARNLTSQSLKSKPRSVSQQSHASSSPTRESKPSKRSTTTVNEAKTASFVNLAQLRDELIQLQHVHSTSTSTLRQFQLSAEKAVCEKSGQLKKQQDILLESEVRNSEALSVKSLDEWLVHDNPNAAAHQIQLLSTTILELDKFKARSDTLAPLQEFEEWLQNALTIADGRMILSSTLQEPLYVTPLGYGWSQQMRNLLFSLHNVRSSLDELKDATVDSGVGVLLTRQRCFVNVLIQEVETAVQIAELIVQVEAAHEKEELSSVLNQIKMPDGEGQYADSQRSGVWM